jgi:site-specific recombinase XerD
MAYMMTNYLYVFLTYPDTVLMEPLRQGRNRMNYVIPETKTIVLRRSDFQRLHDYVLNHASKRDFCLIRVPMKSGLRPGEIRTLRWENVDFTHQVLQVRDSKKHRLIAVPLDLATADYLRELKGERSEGWVISRDPNGRAWRESPNPLSLEQLHHIFRKWARAAGCETWQKMRLYDLRHYFAATWVYPGHGKKPGNLHALSQILRHETLLSTQVYLSRLVFFEDLQAEYDRLQTSPFNVDQTMSEGAGVPGVGNKFFDEFCRVCVLQPTCKFVEEAMSSLWASSCRWFTKKSLDSIPTSVLIAPRGNSIRQEDLGDSGQFHPFR